MPRPAFLLSFTLAACAGPSGREAIGQATHAPLFRPIFDGRTLAGWEGDTRFWRVEDGSIVGESTSERPCERTTYLVWRAGEVADFELALSWRIRGGNSGVQFRSRAPSSVELAGYQADLEAGPDWTGGLYEQDGRGVVARRGERVVFDSSGRRTDERFADGDALLALVQHPGAGGWNELRIVAFGPRLTIAVNGELTSEVIDLDPARAARSGSIALQLHAGPPMRVEFRDLRLRELAETPPETPAAKSTSSWDVRGSPEWIWPDVAVADGQVAWLRKDFELSASPSRAEIWASGDNHFEAWINGKPGAWGDDWPRPVRREVTGALRAGSNQLLVRGENDGSVAAITLVLAIELADGHELFVASDSSWEAAMPDPASVAGGEYEVPESGWARAKSFGGLEADPWRSLRGLLAPEDSGPGSATPASEIEVPPGFRVELLYSVPLAAQGSWISLATDPRGRLYASDQYGGLFRITPPAPGSGGEALVAALPIPLGEAHGLLWAFDALYAVVSGAGGYRSGLHRSRDTDGDGELDRVELLREFEGDGEHGPHAVLLDPDGRSLVIVGGNFTLPPGPFERSRLPPSWGEDALLPPLGDPNGHAVGIRAPGGWIARTDPDGKSWELVAAGFRNPYDAAFSPEGELFTFDADMEWDLGLPWYRPTRILHVTSGAEFGWRSGSACWPADYFDSLPAAADIGLASPTGIVFGTGTGFPPPWKGALFACDWAYGRILAVHLEPEGSSFRGRHEVFASGKPFAVTDVVVGSDGALYVTTGGRQTQAGLYRISWEGAASAPASARPSDDGATSARELRRRLEELHGSPAVPAGEAVALARAHLGDPDPFLRHAARIALESRDPALWSPAVRAERDPRAALQGLLALVRTGSQADAELVLQRAAGIFEGESGSGLALDALRLLELALLRLAAPPSLREALRGRLDPHYPSGNERLDRELLALLVQLGANVQERALARLAAAPTQEERLWILYALRELNSGWSGEDARRFLAAIDLELERVQGGASARGYVERIREEARERLGSAEAPAEDEPAVPAIATAAMAHGSALPVQRWTVAGLEPALARLAERRSFEGGKRAYLAASCQACHRMNGPRGTGATRPEVEGENRGPDLTGAGARYSARDLLVAILEPSREVPDVWRDTEFWGEERLLAAGRIEVEQGGELVVLESYGRRVRVPRDLVRERVPHRLSPMPEGLVDALSRDEILDLLAYVLAGADPADERFSRP